MASACYFWPTGANGEDVCDYSGMEPEPIDLTLSEEGRRELIRWAVHELSDYRLCSLKTASKIHGSKTR